MRFAVSYNAAFFGIDPQGLLGYARHAEECGFEGLYVPEHVALYRGATVGAMQMPPDIPLLDPLDTLAFVAAGTRRLLLGTGVLLLPHHHPVPLAKRLATVDVLSGGRMRLFTVGVGALPGEATAVGIDFASRGRRADEAIDVLRLLWQGGPEGVSHHGEFFDFDDVVSLPHPLGDDLPIHVGGSSRPAARRAGRCGAGYFPGGMLGPVERAEQWQLARKAAEAAGHDPDRLEYTRWGSIDMPPERVAGMASQGVTRIVVSAAATDPVQQREQLSEFAQRYRLVDGVGSY